MRSSARTRTSSRTTFAVSASRPGPAIVGRYTDQAPTTSATYSGFRLSP